MRKLTIVTIGLLSVLTIQAQKVTFVSEGFERGVKAHIGLSEDEEVLQTQTDTITKIDLSGQEISNLNDVLWMPNVKELDLSNNEITDVRPLAELEFLSSVNLKNNYLESISSLTFTRSKKMTVNVGYNYIEDFTAVLIPSHCQFTMIGMNIQQRTDEKVFDVLQLYVGIGKNDQPVVTYRGTTNMDNPVTLSYGETVETAYMDGDSHMVTVRTSGNQSVKVRISNGTYADSTYVVPVNFYPTEANEAITIETGLPEKYRIESTGALYGTVVIDGTKLNYTAPDESMSDVVAFSYYEGARFRGYGYVLTGLRNGDVNGDGVVDIADAVIIVNKILENPPANFIERAADVNRDSKITISDAIGLVNLLLNQ